LARSETREIIALGARFCLEREIWGCGAIMNERRFRRDRSQTYRRGMIASGSEKNAGFSKDREAPLFHILIKSLQYGSTTSWQISG
jgi:hypothetical protein